MGKDIFERLTDINDKAAFVQGLVVAQIICKRALTNAFDVKCQEVVLHIMEEIYNTLEKVEHD